MALVLSQPPPAPTLAYAVGNRALTAEEEVMIRRVAGNEPLHAVYLLDNERVEVIPAVGTDDDNNNNNAGGEILTGAAYEFLPGAVVRSTSPLFAHGDRLFGHVLVATVNDPTLDEGLVRKKFTTLKEKIHVHSTRPYSFKTADTEPWEHQLGSHGHFVGVYKEESDRAMPAFYLVVHSDAGQVGQEFLDQFVRPKVGHITYRDLVESDEYKRTALFSYRNARRLLCEAANHLGLSILHIADTWASVEKDSFDAPPDLAVEQSNTPYNMLRLLPSPHGESVVFFSRATHLDSCKGDVVAHLVDPAYGVVLYKGDPMYHAQHTAPWTNDWCSAFPIGTGRVLDSSVVDANRKRMQRERLTREFFNTIVQWQGRSADTLALTHTRLGAYQDYSTERQRIHAEHLGAAHGHVRLKPVCVIIAPPSKA